MTTPPVGVERRAGQRFPFLLPVCFRDLSSAVEGVGFSQDLSSRGVFFLTDATLHQGASIEITLNMPSEITLGDSMRVRCRGRILRIVPTTAPDSPGETKIGVAVRLEGYEYLPESIDSAAAFPRVSALHGHHDEEQPQALPSSRRPAVL